MKRKTPDLSLLEDVVAEKVLRAMRVASAQLKALGVRHVLVGALAVGAHGYPRATKDVDFLVGNEAFEFHEAGLVSLRPGVPIQVSGVVVDHLSVREGEGHLESALAAGSGEVPVAPVEAVVYLKLRSPRRRDHADVVELVKEGLDVAACRRYLEAHAPDLVDLFDELALEPEREEE
jgi:hypothetical protein